MDPDQTNFLLAYLDFLLFSFFLVMILMEVEAVIISLFFISLIPHLGFSAYWLFQTKILFKSKGLYYLVTVFFLLEIIALGLSYFLSFEFWAIKDWLGLYTFFVLPRAAICAKQVNRHFMKSDILNSFYLTLSFIFPLIFSWSLEYRLKNLKH